MIAFFSVRRRPRVQVPGSCLLPRGVRTIFLNRAPKSCYQERRHVCGAASPTHVPAALNPFFSNQLAFPSLILLLLPPGFIPFAAGRQDSPVR